MTAQLFGAVCVLIYHQDLEVSGRKGSLIRAVWCCMDMRCSVALAGMGTCIFGRCQTLTS